MQSNWVKTMMEQIANGIELARDGKSDQWISDRTEQLGHPISRTAVSEYRRGIRKTMPVTDWLVLSAALGVPPVALLFQGFPDQPNSFIPALEKAPAFDCVMWVSGERQTMPELEDPLEIYCTFNPEGGAQGRSVFQTYSRFLGGAFDRYCENEPSTQTRLIKLSREMHKVSQRIFEMTIPDRFNEENFPKPVWEGMLKQYVAELDKSSKRIKELEKEISALGGILLEEEVTQDGEED